MMMMMMMMMTEINEIKIMLVKTNGSQKQYVNTSTVITVSK